MGGSKEGISWVIGVVGVMGGHGERGGLPVDGVWHGQGMEEGGLEGLGGGVFVAQEQGSHILSKGSNTVSGPGEWLVLSGGGVEMVHVL
jgi:hypothetical protein